MIFPASCVGCFVELEQSAFEESIQLLAAGQNTGTDVATATPELNSGYYFQRWQATHWCDRCWKKMTPAVNSRCGRCGATLNRPSPLGNQCAHCFGHDLRFDRAYAIGNYQGLLQELVIRMKNQHDEALALQLGTFLGYELLAQGWTEFDQLVSVPSHWMRKLKRGFQAADILGERVSQLIGIPKCSQTVSATRTTAKQGTLSTTGRRANVHNAFKLHAKANIEGQHVLIIDDVLTSGATTSELARILKQHGAAEVSVAVVARGAGVS